MLSRWFTDSLILETKLLGKLLVHDHHLNSAIVGQGAVDIAKLAGIFFILTLGFSVPPTTVCLVGEAVAIGPDEPMSFEKLCPVLGLYKARDFSEGLNLCESLIAFDGKGHTSVLYSEVEDHVAAFQKKISTCRVLINLPSAMGAIGDIFNFHQDPSLTLGVGRYRPSY